MLRKFQPHFGKILRKPRLSQKVTFLYKNGLSLLPFIIFVYKYKFLRTYYVLRSTYHVLRIPFKTHFLTIFFRQNAPFIVPTSSICPKVASLSQLEIASQHISWDNDATLDFCRHLILYVRRGFIIELPPAIHFFLYGRRAYNNKAAPAIQKKCVAGGSSMMNTKFCM